VREVRKIENLLGKYAHSNCFGAGVVHQDGFEAMLMNTRKG
jgi:hypothetical protein